MYGMRESHPGLFEIIICNPKKRNAIGTPPEEVMLTLFQKANDDPNIKVIMLHGGRFFSSGNDLSLFAKMRSPE